MGGRWDGIRTWLAEEDTKQGKKRGARKEKEISGGDFWERAGGLNFLERPAVTEREKNSLRGSKLGSFGLRSPGMYTVFLSFFVIHCFSLDCYYTSKHHVVWGGY